MKYLVLMSLVLFVGFGMSLFIKDGIESHFKVKYTFERFEMKYRDALATYHNLITFYPSIAKKDISRVTSIKISTGSGFDFSVAVADGEVSHPNIFAKRVHKEQYRYSCDRDVCRISLLFYINEFNNLKNGRDHSFKLEVFGGAELLSSETVELENYIFTDIDEQSFPSFSAEIVNGELLIRDIDAPEHDEMVLMVQWRDRHGKYHEKEYDPGQGVLRHQLSLSESYLGVFLYIRSDNCSYESKVDLINSDYKEPASVHPPRNIA